MNFVLVTLRTHGLRKLIGEQLLVLIIELVDYGGQAHLELGLSLRHGWDIAEAIEVMRTSLRLVVLLNLLVDEEDNLLEVVRHVFHLTLQSSHLAYFHAQLACK